MPTSCPCCGAWLVRASELPETRRWLRAGDRWCFDCEWAVQRESALEDARPELCAKHLAENPKEVRDA